jgi:dinuclear metal center YbgI/SA1388 family protein
MIVKEVAEILETLAPAAYAEDFDNVGLLVGNPETKVNGILITLDTLESVVGEALSKNCNLIVSFHPILFGGLKKITGATYVERTVMKALENGIAIYAIHTALDNAWQGVNAKLADVLGLQNRQILIPQPGNLRKLTTYVPEANAATLRDALFEAGAGHIGNYSHCSFAVGGSGSFKAGEGAVPAKGSIGKVHYENEVQLQLVYPRDLEKKVLGALLESHPYEEVAYEILPLENNHPRIGMGMIGFLEEATAEEEFLAMVKDRLGVPVIRHSVFLRKKVRKIAVLGGSGAFAIARAKAAGADVLLTSDIKYHQFFEAENQLLLLDVGHFESEQFTKNLLLDYLTKKIPNFAISLSESITNPINYYF